MAAGVSRQCLGGSPHLARVAAPAAVTRSGSVPRSEPSHVRLDGAANSTGAPRGLPSQIPDWLLWCGDEPDPAQAQAPRTVPVIRDRAARALVRRRTAAESGRVIGPLFVTLSLRACGGLRAVCWFNRGSSWRRCDPGLICDVRLRRYLWEDVGNRYAREFAQSRASSLRIHPHASSRGPPPGAATWWLGQYATIQFGEAKERSWMAVAIRGSKGEVKWLWCP